MLDEVVSNVEVNFVSTCVCDCSLKASVELSVDVAVDSSFEEVVVDIPVFRFFNLFNTVNTHLKGHATLPESWVRSELSLFSESVF